MIRTMNNLFAQVSCSTDVKLPNCGKNITGVSSLSNLISFVSALAGIICVLVIVLAGLRYITSSGNPDSLTKAKNQIIYALIGLVVSLSAFTIVRFALNSL